MKYKISYTDHNNRVHTMTVTDFDVYAAQMQVILKTNCTQIVAIVVVGE